MEPMMIRKLHSGNHTIHIERLGQMKALAQILAESLSECDIVALTGDLGSGKTTFTQFACAAFNVEQSVTSPTFTLFNEYMTDEVAILHADFYRLSSEQIAQCIPELEEYSERRRFILFIEWADKSPEFEPCWTWHLHFQLNPDNMNTRKVTLWCQDQTKLVQLIDKLGQQP